MCNWGGNEIPLFSFFLQPFGDSVTSFACFITFLFIWLVE
jgi:hypothetical protein